MVTITLAKAWTDANGVAHPKGAEVDIPESLLDDLVGEGYVAIQGGDGSNDGMRWS
jgi:hypothetical protein